jgi:hypothetical protein
MCASGTAIIARSVRSSCRTCSGPELAFRMNRNNESAAANVGGLNPKHWQNIAEEARVVAESMRDEQSKQLMLRVAKRCASYPQKRREPLRLRNPRLGGRIGSPGRIGSQGSCLFQVPRQCRRKEAVQAPDRRCPALPPHGNEGRRQVGSPGQADPQLQSSCAAAHESANGTEELCQAPLANVC